MLTQRKPQRPIRVEAHLYEDANTLQIGDKLYEIIRYDGPDEDLLCLHHVRLIEEGRHEGHDVATLRAGYYDCTCADHIYRSGPAGRLCKHIQACLDTGLLGRLEAWTEHEINEREMSF